MMKRTFSLLLVLCMLAALSVNAFAEMPRADAVRELYTAEGFYFDEIGNEYVYNYHVPQINDDTPAADEINAEIAEEFGKIVEYQFDNMEDELSLWCRDISWISSWSGSELFLLVCAHEESDITKYHAFAYDFASGERLTNEMILRERGITPEEYAERLREKVISTFEERNAFLSEEKRELIYDNMLSSTLSWLEDNEDIFIDRFGQIEVPVRFCSIAGAGYYYHIVTLSVNG